MRGNEINKEKSLKNLISQELLFQGATEKGYKTSETEAELIFQLRLRGQNVSLREVKSQFEEAGISYEEAFLNLQKQMNVQKYLDGILENFAFEVSKSEVKLIYEANKDLFGEEPSTLEEATPGIANAIANNKKQEFIDTYVQQLWSEADIEIK